MESPEADKTHHQRGDDGTRTAENASASGEADIMESFAQHPDDNAGDHHRGSVSIDWIKCSGCYWLSERRRPWLAECLYWSTRSLREVHYRVTDEASEIPATPCFRVQTQRDGDTE